MIGKILEKKKYKDFYNFKAWECKVSIIITIIIFLLLINTPVDIVTNFSNYIETLKNIVIYIASGLLAMIGVIMAGIALILSLLSKKFRQSIKGIGNTDPSKDIMLSFEFLVINLAFGSILFFLLYFMLSVDINIGIWPFYITLFLFIYYFNFLIFYTIALIENTIDLYFIKDLYEEIDLQDKSLYDKVNEIRIDYLLKNSNVTSKEELLESLESIVDEMNIQNKDEIKKYFRNYYNN